MSDFEVLRRLAAQAALSEEEVDQAQQFREHDDPDTEQLEARTPAHPIPELSDDEVSALMSDEARLAVIGFEVTSEKQYKRAYERPILPGVASGITVGIGYDLGYSTPERVRRDFKGLIAADDIEALVAVCTLKGDAARPHLASLRQRIRISWDVAIEVYRRVTVPLYGRAVLKTFPNAVELKGHCFGALLSLVYNRGASLKGDRRREMNTIHDLMAQRQWADIPAQFRSMKRIWKGNRQATGVVIRREAEAILFERGLELLQAPIVVAGLESNRPEGDQLESVEPPDLETIEGDGFHYVELDDNPDALERHNPNWDKVKWPPEDRAPDYSHIPDRSLANTAFEFGPRELELLIEANNFRPSREHGRIVFALRGAQLIQALDKPEPMKRQENREVLTLREIKPDHRAFCCVIGVYDVERGRMSGYIGSTVPNPKAVASFVAGGSPSNMMLSGCYEFEVGWHQRSKSIKKIPGCLIESGRRKAVLRTRKNHTYEIVDIVHDTLPGDNIHPGKREGPFPFSSWGCL
ncbi:MAG TPA: hypothetical protein VMX97_13965, partial [Hyphomicrobiaceae bacterium]|nr:hypothetical protein [Hyphomicrobiaceae bacterium]